MTHTFAQKKKQSRKKLRVWKRFCHVFLQLQKNVTSLERNTANFWYLNLKDEKLNAIIGRIRSWATYRILTNSHH